MSHIDTSRVSHANASCRIYVTHASYIRGTWLVRMPHVTHSYVRHDTSIRDTCLFFYTWVMLHSHVRHGLCHMWDMTRSYVRHDSLTCDPRLIQMSHMTHPNVKHDSLMRDIWLCHVWVTTHILMLDRIQSYVRHDSFKRESWLTHMRHMTRGG